MSVVIKAENISKQYKLGNVGMSNLSDDVQRLLATLRGKEDPFLKVGGENIHDKSISKTDSKFVWALRDINFEINQGEVVGIIGKNGAGKSTLLKILSRVTEPTIGSLKYKGRLASLLEVGTGFHPELTGRDNVYLNGAILGMKRHEIAKKFDEIVEFSGVAKYIDTPVKRYSSGMYVRLAFAVAAHLEPDILVIDEVLAVGDQEFQDKCLGKMKDVAGQGRTVLFVSHNIHAIKAICKTGIYLERGQTVLQGGITEVINKYLRANLGEQSFVNNFKSGNPQDSFYRINKVYTKNYLHELSNQIEISKEFTFSIDYTVKESCYVKISFIVKNAEGIEAFASLNNHEPNFSKSKQAPGNYITELVIPGNFLNSGGYFLSLICSSESNWKESFVVEDAIYVNCIDDGVLKADYFGDFGGLLRPKLNWITKKID